MNNKNAPTAPTAGGSATRLQTKSTGTGRMTHILNEGATVLHFQTGRVFLMRKTIRAQTDVVYFHMMHSVDATRRSAFDPAYECAPLCATIKILSPDAALLDAKDPEALGSELEEAQIILR